MQYSPVIPIIPEATGSVGPHETRPALLTAVRSLPSLNAGSPILHIHILRGACLRDNSVNSLN